MKTPEQLEKELADLIDYGIWLSNDCGDCETCSRTFSQQMHDMHNRDVKALPEEYRERYYGARP